MSGDPFDKHLDEEDHKHGLDVATPLAIIAREGIRRDEQNHRSVRRHLAQVFRC